jgi:large subunit ribosomal protein L1
MAQKNKKKTSKRYAEAAERVGEDGGPFRLEEAAKVVKETATANFDETITIDLRLGVDPRHADQMVRGSVALPHGTGQEVRVLVLAPEGKQAEAVEAGADFVGLEEYIDKIEDGWTEMDTVIATPDVMGQVGRLGRILGPRGLMPNPKSGTVTDDIARVVEEVKQGKVEFRVDRYGNLHVPVGKASFDASDLAENVQSLMRELIRLRPASAKGAYVRSITLSATMGPPVPVETASTVAAAR